MKWFIFACVLAIVSGCASSPVSGVKIVKNGITIAVMTNGVITVEGAASADGWDVQTIE